MTPITFLQAFIMLFFTFIPVWAGGQAMRCYDQGHIFRSVVCVWIAMLLNVGIFCAGYAVFRYNLSFVTILAALKL